MISGIAKAILDTADSIRLLSQKGSIKSESGYEFIVIGMDTKFALTGIGVRASEYVVALGLYDVDEKISWAYGKYFDCKEDAWTCFEAISPYKIWIVGEGL